VLTAWTGLVNWQEGLTGEEFMLVGCRCSQPDARLKKGLASLLEFLDYRGYLTAVATAATFRQW
jgi:hypothetical protein